MNKTGTEPSGTSNDGPADLLTGTAPPTGTREQGSSDQQYPRRRRPMRVLAVVSAVAAAALAAVITAALHAVPGTLSPAAAPSPLSAVTSALTRTSAQSYTFSLDTTVQLSNKELNSDVVSGAYDPRQHLGTELVMVRSAGRTRHAQISFIGAYLYTSVSAGSGFGKPWDKSPLAAARAAGTLGHLYGFVSDQPISPSELTVVLRSAGTAMHRSGPVSGPGWTGNKYTFTASLYDGQEPVSGTVYVDQQGLVRRLITVTTEKGKQATGKTLLTTDRDITFGDFGAPVRVTTPPARQVKFTSGEPYVGFYF